MLPADSITTRHVARALLAQGWVENVSISWDASGVVQSIVPTPAGTAIAPMAIWAGVPNAHSHAHQRAMAGLAERAGNTEDSFWTWRKTMYRMLAQLNPDDLHAIASQLYLEMLKAGYTHVAEFQYLHHQPGGAAYENSAEMSLQCARAASDIGLGITLLPVQYRYAGFDLNGPNQVAHRAAGPEQARFITDESQFLKLLDTLRRSLTSVGTEAPLYAGVAAHSLRATSAGEFNAVLTELNRDPYWQNAPVHLHVAEQIKEVEDCLAATGRSPVEYCLDEFDVDARWCLVHATHVTQKELADIAQSGAVVCLCPTTEANLGDGVFPAKAFQRLGGNMAIGSDSHISTSPVEELRWLEYGQRLLLHERNVLADGADSSTGAALVHRAVRAGARACGLNTISNEAGLAVGASATFVGAPLNHPLLVGREGDYLLDAWVFSGNQNPITEVVVGGKTMIENGRHANEHQINERFARAMRRLRNAR